MPGEQDPSQQDVSRFEAFKSTLSSAAESIKGKTAIALIGVVGLTGASAIESQVSTEPANAANVPEATASDQLQDCVDAALDDPLVMRSNMYFTGAKHNQTIDGFMRFKPTSAACASLVSRETPIVQVKMQRPNNHSKFIKSKKKELTNHPDGETVPMDANTGRLGGAYFSKYNGDGNKLRYRCTPGEDITKAWMTYTVRAASPEDGKTLGKKSFTQQVKIPHKPRRLLRDHELPGPC